MHILVINCGSSSVKTAVVHEETGNYAMELKIERLGQEGRAVATFDKEPAISCPHTHEAALSELIPKLLERLQAADITLQGVGHRAVHGGDHGHRALCDELV